MLLVRTCSLLARPFPLLSLARTAVRQPGLPGYRRGAPRPSALRPGSPSCSCNANGRIRALAIHAGLAISLSAARAVPLPPQQRRSRRQAARLYFAHERHARRAGQRRRAFILLHTLVRARRRLNAAIWDAHSLGNSSAARGSRCARRLRWIGLLIVRQS